MDTSIAKKKSGQKKSEKGAGQKEKAPRPDEVCCYNCVRTKTAKYPCNICAGFSCFKNIEKLNAELKEKGIDYLCVSSIEELRKQQSVEDELLNLIDDLVSMRKHRGRRKK